MDLIRIICDFYFAYHDTLNYSHEEARRKIENMYDDFYEWIYHDELKKVNK